MSELERLRAENARLLGMFCQAFDAMDLMVCMAHDAHYCEGECPLSLNKDECLMTRLADRGYEMGIDTYGILGLRDFGGDENERA